MNPLDSTVSGDMSMVMSDSANMTHAPLFGGGMLAFQIALYVFFAYSQYTLSKKMNIQYSWMAWLPILGIFNLVKIAGLSSWWILGMFIPLWNIYAIIKIFHGISKNTGHGAGWTIGLIFLYIIFLPLTAFTYKSNQAISTSPLA